MSNSFFDLPFTETVVSIDEYIGQVPAGFKRRRVQSYLQGIDRYPASIFRGWAGRHADLPIVVRTDSDPERVERQELNAQASEMANQIVLNAALVEHALRITPLPIDDIVRSDRARTIFKYDTVGRAAILFTCAHETFHVLRKHEHVRDGDDAVDLFDALERDADLCAVVELYRAVQRVYGHHLADLVVRQIVAYMLYSFFRSLPEASTERSNVPAALRYWDVLRKLATIRRREHPGILPDSYFREHATMTRFVEIANTFSRCEGAYLSARPSEQPNDWRLQIDDLETAGRLRGAVSVWDGLRARVSRETGTVT